MRKKRSPGSDGRNARKPAPQHGDKADGLKFEIIGASGGFTDEVLEELALLIAEEALARAKRKLSETSGRQPEIPG